ncbi:unnamed protein product [Alopecurus aequalis]
MATGDSRVRVTRRSIVKASGGFRASPRVLAVSNLDLLPQSIPNSLFCVYRKPSTGGFGDVVAAFEAKLLLLLDYFLPLTGRLTGSWPPEVYCDNQGGELVLGEYGAGVALSVQLLSFACGGYAVAWGSNHSLMDGYSLCMMANAWSQLARFGTVPATAMNHDRSVFRPRAAPSYGSTVGEAFAPLRGEHLVNALTCESSFVRRTYYVEARDLATLRARANWGRPGERVVATRLEALSAYLWKALASAVGSSDESCRMGWWVNGRKRLTSARYQAAGMGDYIGNVITFAAAESSVEAVQRRPLPSVASMVRESIRSTATEEHFQELVDWVEDHKDVKYVEEPAVGLGSPMLAVTSFAQFSYDTDFGFGHAALAVPTAVTTLRLCYGFVQIIARPGPGDDGGWILTMYVWPRLAAVLDSDEESIFKPLTAEYLGLTLHSRL